MEFPVVFKQVAVIRVSVAAHGTHKRFLARVGPHVLLQTRPRRVDATARAARELGDYTVAEAMQWIQICYKFCLTCNEKGIHVKNIKTSHHYKSVRLFN